ncbi:hypothetical protein CDAR_53031 [Caerostris darwini]|uniref:Uncharacterized protein n=1 Tax=Caerostris darwini TaxID=1538125 RepID=A0AAV4QR13_9ARAC|nr:hypothetical protein CDAR_53031 [Caerostris darwini]
MPESSSDVLTDHVHVTSYSGRSQKKGGHERESKRNEITLTEKIFIYFLLCFENKAGVERGADLPLANSLSRNFILSEFQPNRNKCALNSIRTYLFILCLPSAI